MYPEDFSTADAAYAPVTDGLFVGVSPLLFVTLLLLLAASTALGWWLGRGSGSHDRGDEGAPAEIHKAILAASSAAMAASSNDLKARAQALRDKIADLLGPVLDVAKGVSPAVKALDEALEGKKKGATTPAPPAPPPSVARAGCSCGKPDACSCSPAPAGGPVTVNQVYIGGAPLAAAPSCGCSGAHKPECAHAATKPDTPQPAASSTVAMTGPEQTEALAKAVRQFHDHWLDRPARIRELKAARAALSRRPPATTAKSHRH